jgi:hypothetical protein
MLPYPELSRGNELCSNAVMCELVWDFARTEATFRFLYEVNFRSRVYITIPLDSYTDFSNSMHVTTLAVLLRYAVVGRGIINSHFGFSVLTTTGTLKTLFKSSHSGAHTKIWRLKY